MGFATTLLFMHILMFACVLLYLRQPGATLGLRTKLTQFGIPLKSSATVRADLKRPDSTSSTLNLSEVEDGVFETTTLAPILGIYNFRIYCNGVTLRVIRIWYKSRDFT